MKQHPQLNRKVLAKDLGERALLERIIKGFSPHRGSPVIVGPGDDAAVIKLRHKHNLIITTDMVVEGTHFKLAWSFPEAVGFKAVSANLSDIAAMGGSPAGVVVSLGIPPGIPVRAIDGMYRGMSKALSVYGGEFLGGDTVRSGKIIVSVSAIGFLVGRKPHLRSGARPGDKVCVTGSLGSSRVGLILLRKYFRERKKSRKAALDSWAERKKQYFKKNLPDSILRNGYACISDHLMPSPRVKEARVLSGYEPSAIIDLSDGLSADLMQIARASKVGVMLHEKDIPFSKSAQHVGKVVRVSPLSVALSSGEEYELLFTISPGRVRQVARALAGRCATRVSVIGEITDREKGIVLACRDGKTRRLEETGFRHF